MGNMLQLELRKEISSQIKYHNKQYLLRIDAEQL